ncbi:hypothetical protein ACIA6T_06065 [Streptomyces sp. NPDC051740]|uniref:hypothetical protein n=1 Tax=Streptomyces sp. NPDC051740 TaxID=3365673 RepID=UPI00379561A9
MPSPASEQLLRELRASLALRERSEDVARLIQDLYAAQGTDLDTATEAALAEAAGHSPRNLWHGYTSMREEFARPVVLFPAVGGELAALSSRAALTAAEVGYRLDQVAAFIGQDPGHGALLDTGRSVLSLVPQRGEDRVDQVQYGAGEHHGHARAEDRTAQRPAGLPALMNCGAVTMGPAGYVRSHGGVK